MYYFSYGSNMDVSNMERQCPDAKFLGVAFLEGYELIFTKNLEERGRMGADIISKKEKSVWGLLYELEERDLHAIDRSKIYPKVYNRFKVSVLLRTMMKPQLVDDVWTYELVDKSLASSQPEKQYVELLIQASEKYNFPKYYVEELKKSIQAL